ncbi:MAG: thioredoxin [Bdellovibrionaceae bacterium]|nr:thioredoxin [Pseudobdellovibrionaceae bacterium]
MPLMDLTQENFDDETEKHPLIFLDFWAAWCNPCKAFAPVFESASKEHPDILFAKINCDEQPELAKQFQVMSIPTLIAVKDGIIVEAKVGMVTPPHFAKMISSCASDCLEIASLKPSSGQWTGARSLRS